MKYIRPYFSLILFIILIFNGVTKAFATNTGFSTESLAESSINTFLKNVNISMSTTEPLKKSIDCFSVNENGLIAIGSSDHEIKTVCVYTTCGNFQYSFNFKCTGSFGIEMDNNNILYIYFVRSDVAVSVSPDGEILNVRKILNTSENNDYWNKSVYLTKRSVGDEVYILKNNTGIFSIFASSYSQLVRINSNGEKTVLYDVSSEQLIYNIVLFSIFLFIALFVFGISFQFHKNKMKNDDVTHTAK